MFLYLNLKSIAQLINHKRKDSTTIRISKLLYQITLLIGKMRLKCYKTFQAIQVSDTALLLVNIY